MSSIASTDQRCQLRFRHIDALRGLAAVAVVFRHVTLMLEIYLPASDRAFLAAFDKWFSPGEYGVFLFFLISGFVIPFGLKGEPRVAVARFAVNRFFRLYPLYWLSMLLAIGGIAASGVGAFPMRLVVVNLTMLQGFFGTNDLIETFWTLKVELAFYILCAALYLLGCLHRPRVAFAVGTGVALLSCLETMAVGPDGAQCVRILALSAMMLGLLLRASRATGDASAARFAKILSGVNVASAIVAGAGSLPVDMIAAISTFYAAGPARGALVDAAAWIGERSYGLYLVHLPVLMLFGAALGGRLAGVSVFVDFALVLGLSLALSHVLHVLVERPCIAMGRRIAAGIGEKAVASVTA